jgi:hypothetical protein
MKYGVLNPHFDFYNCTEEQDFYSDFVDESIQIAGTETLFIPKDYASIDSILGEPFQTLYTRFFPLAAVLTTPEGYGGEGDMMSQFGMRFANTSEWVISKRLFRELKIPGRDVRPLEGDLLLIGPTLGQTTYVDPQFTYSMMEITYVKHEAVNWPLGRYYVFQVMCQLYVASYEKFQTGHPDIDLENSQYSNAAELNIAANKDFDDKRSELVDFSENNPLGKF